MSSTPLSANEIITSLEEMIEYSSDYHAYRKAAHDYPSNRVELDIIYDEIQRAKTVLDKLIDAEQGQAS